MDGLRALAILAVIAFHVHPFGIFRIGWFGVPLFFVISGFLITRILLATRDRPHYFRNFFIRRSLRIFPIYYGYIAAVSLVAVVRWSQDISQLPYYLTYTQTIPMVILRDGSGALPWTAHTWSLAIEEQFYAAWPVLLLLATGRRLYALLWGLVAAALAYRVWALLGSANPYLMVGTLPSVMDALAAGGLIAAALHDRVEVDRVRNVAYAVTAIGFLGIGGIIHHLGFGAFVTTDWARSAVAPLVITAMSVAFGGLTALTVTQARATRWLEWAPLRYVGTRSYGLYLYHLVILDLGHAFLKGALGAGADGLLGSLGAVVLVFLVAEASYRWIERPLLALKDRYTR